MPGAVLGVGTKVKKGQQLSPQGPPSLLRKMDTNEIVQSVRTSNGDMYYRGVQVLWQRTVGEADLLVYFGGKARLEEACEP